jgi:hypothetical protein
MPNEALLAYGKNFGTIEAYFLKDPKAFSMVNQGFGNSENYIKLSKKNYLFIIISQSDIYMCEKCEFA